MAVPTRSLHAGGALLSVGAAGKIGGQMSVDPQLNVARDSRHSRLISLR